MISNDDLYVKLNHDCPWQYANANYLHSKVAFQIQPILLGWGRYLTTWQNLENEASLLMSVYQQLVSTRWEESPKFPC